MKVKVYEAAKGNLLFEYEGKHIPKEGEMLFVPNEDYIMEIDYVATSLCERDGELIQDYIEIGVNLS